MFSTFSPIPVDHAQNPAHTGGMSEPNLMSFLSDRNGVARTRELEDAGIKRARITAALNSGACIRPRHGWIARRDADPLLIAAARDGFVLTCVTQAARFGLWVHDQTAERIHVAPRTNRAEHTHPRATVHWAEPLVRRHPHALVDSVQNVLAHAAECVPFEHAIAMWDSALNQRFVTLDGLARLPLSRRARRVLAQTNPFADSGLESYVRQRLRWMRIPLRFQIFIHGHRVDLLIGDRLVLQIDGGTHVGAQREEDIRHDAELRLLGYTVFRFGYAQVMHRWHEVQDLIMRAVAQGLHRVAA